MCLSFCVITTPHEAQEVVDYFKNTWIGRLKDGMVDFHLSFNISFNILGKDTLRHIPLLDGPGKQF